MSDEAGEIPGCSGSGKNSPAAVCADWVEAFRANDGAIVPEDLPARVRPLTQRPGDHDYRQQ